MDREQITALRIALANINLIEDTLMPYGSDGEKATPMDECAIAANDLRRKFEKTLIEGTRAAYVVILEQELGENTISNPQVTSVSREIPSRHRLKSKAASFSFQVCLLEVVITVYPRLGKQYELRIAMDGGTWSDPNGLFKEQLARIEIASFSVKEAGERWIAAKLRELAGAASE